MFGKNIIDLDEAIDGDYNLIDIRTVSEINSTGIIKNAKNVVFKDESGHYDLDKIVESLKSIENGKKIVLVCRVGGRSKMLMELLKGKVDTLSADKGTDYIIATRGEDMVK